MRKLKLQMHLSLDGFVSGPNGEMDWIVASWDPELKKYVYNLTRPVETILLGRNTASVFIESWQDKMNDPLKADIFTEKMNETPKIVFSKKLENINWKNTKLYSGNFAEEIKRLKSLKGRDLIVYGGASFVASLMKESLIDEFNFFINPVVLGKGISIFQELNRKLELEMVYSTSFDCGITAICYILKNNLVSDQSKVKWTTDHISGV